MFQRFTMVLNNMRANVTMLSYNDHDKAMQLLYFLYHTVWGAKDEPILELGTYETLTADELFSKLKLTEVDRGVMAKIVRLTHVVSLSSEARVLGFSAFHDAFAR
jgi:hypothetical protein